MIEVALIGIVLYLIFGRIEVFLIVIVLFVLFSLWGASKSNKCPNCKGSGYSDQCKCLACNGIGRVLK